MDEFRDKYDKKKNIVTGIQSVITTRKITSVTTALIMLALIGVFQFITLGCDISNLLTWSFYLTLLYRTVLVLLAYYVAINFLYDKCIAQPDIQNAITEFRTLTKIRDINFSDFLTNVYNPRRKKEAWKNKINLEIAGIERKILKVKRKRKKEKLVNKIKNLKEQLTDEYIDPRIDTLQVKYYIVLESDFVAAEAVDENSIYKTRIDYDSELFKSIMKKILPYILMSIVMGALVTASINKPAYEVIINLLTDISIIVLRISQGAWDAPRIINSSYLIPYSNRISILNEYINWSAEMPKSKAHILVSKLEEETENKEGE